MSNKINKTATRQNFTGIRRVPGPIGFMPDSYGAFLREVGRYGPKMREMTRMINVKATAITIITAMGANCCRAIG
ncbi:MAG: hypothetical protein BroJett007_28110 [Chloroflexota bacterium]|nr:MAG: hypothetical protein BroJett007_28110 [Chloroflexota bacterium]